MATWIFKPEIIIFTWGIDDIFSTSFFVFSYWFLYSFAKDRDLPLWQKAISACALIPAVFIIGSSVNMDTFYAPSGIAFINQAVLNYNSLLELFFVIVIIIFSIWEYFKAENPVNKKKIALAGSGVAIFLFIFFVAWGVTNFLTYINFQGLADTGYLYNVTLYSFLGMPILLTFLGYLIAKYQAFDLRLIKSIVLIAVLAVLLFIGLFFA
ncbi:MAG: hypothetical protein PHS95_03345 [Candidatus Pacebacteria bacterium]|nr:hypothetical protein [Candidatus Paceibacterota bacterium]